MKGILNTTADQETYSTFGEALRHLRTRRGLSLTELAERTHYSKGHLNNLERGARTPTVELAQACDDVLASGSTLRSLVSVRRRSNHSTAVLPAQLPGRTRRFVGRHHELRQLDSLLTEVDPSAVAAINGPPGVGKTELALSWAHAHASRFPDGQLYVDLRGHASAGDPANPVDVLEEFLVALVCPPEHMPATGDERARLFRSMMHERRMLLVLDNAASSTQVRPLLPAGRHNVVVVTSRARLEGLVVRDGAAEMTLQPFDPDEAIRLLRDVVGSERVDAQPDMASKVARYCGYLPLAIRLAAERIAIHPDFTMEILAADLVEERARLDALAASDDADTAVRAVFSWSYRNLDSAEALMFRVLGLHAGPEVDIGAAAALGNIPVEHARRQLENLANAHLVEHVGPGRFRQHDLIRLYATERCEAEIGNDARRDAITRELTYYLHRAEAASHMFAPAKHITSRPGQEPMPSSIFSSYEEALAWCEADLANMVSGTRQAARNGLSDIAWQLPVALFEFFHLRKPWNVWANTYRTGLMSARACGSRYGEAFMRQGLGLVALGRRQPADAQEHFQQALAIRQEIGDVPGQAWSLTALSQVVITYGDWETATANLELALRLHHEVGDQQGEAVTLIHLSCLLRKQHRADKAIDRSQEALKLARAIGDRHCEGLALHQLGDAYLATEHVNDSLNCLRQAIEVRRAAGDLKGAADSMFLLGRVAVHAGQKEKAARHLEGALEIYDDRDDPAVAEVRTALQLLATSPQAI